MDPQTEMILREISTLRADMKDGFGGINDRLDALNGRTRRNTEAIVGLETRTENMVCVEHAERFRAIEKAVEKIEAHEPPSRAKSLAISGGAVAGAVALLEGVWHWVTK